MEHQSVTHQQGFAMLFTVLIVSLILSIAVGISNLTLRQTILSALAKDSGVAFYQADAGVECGMYEDTNANFPLGTTVDQGLSTDAKSVLDCGGIDMQLDVSKSYTDHIEYIPQDSTIRNSNQPCFSIIFDKTAVLQGGKSIVRARGYSSCAQSPRQVERLLQVTY
jgi:Tfp pilus assembly protein PilX